MAKTTPAEEEALADRSQKRLVGSRLINGFVTWVVRTATRILARRRLGEAPVEELPVEKGARIGLDATLQQIAEDVVHALGYVGAMVATYEESDGSLPSRAFYVDPDLATEEKIRQWEERASGMVGRPLSITDPNIATVLLHEKKYEDNLSVKAYKAGRPVTTAELYDLCTPVAPPITRPFINGIGEGLGIEQLIAVPFFLETPVDDQPTGEDQPVREIVGNLFAAKRGEIPEQDMRALAAFGRQAATAIASERRHRQIQVAQKISFEMQSSLQDEDRILQRIAEWVVSDLKYIGAMVATYEPDGSLPARAFHVDPDLATEEKIRQWEERASGMVGRPLSITDPDIARVFLDKKEYEDNLSVKAHKAGRPVTTAELYDLCTPVAPPITKPFIKGIQEGLGIEQLIAVPFFLGGEFVGNLFAAKKSLGFSRGEIELLGAFGQQAAIAIRNARLYRKAEDRRQVAEVFGRMAFSATASVHTLRNHIAALRAHFEMMQMTDLSAEHRRRVRDMGPEILNKLNDAAGILTSLRDPWRVTPDVLTSVNACLLRAVNKVIPVRDKNNRTSEGITLHDESLPDDLPAIKTSPDMLTEAFRVMVKNAVEAIRENGEGGDLWVESHLGDDAIVEVVIRDTGIGIKPENLSKIFEMGWSTKKAGMGFGLFWAKDYIEGLGGSIQVESVPQQGTAFRIRLPVATEQIDIPPSQVDTQKGA